MSKVSVIIPSYNAAQFLPETIDSILAQTYTEYEVIVINDGSTDQTLEVLKPYHSQIIVIDQENQGVSAARNAGIRRSTGKYLVFMDADDIFLPGKLEKQVYFLEQHPNVCAVFSDVLAFSVDKLGEKQSWLYPVKESLKAKIGPPKENAHIFMVQNILPPVATMVRKTCIQDIGGFDLNLSGLEDRDYWYRLGCKHEFAYLREPTAEYRIYPASLSSDASRMIAEHEKLAKKQQSSEHYLSSSRWRKSYYLMHHGLSFLFYGETQSAKEQLEMALKIFPLNLLALGAYFAIVIFGKNALALIHFKRTIFDEETK